MNNNWESFKRFVDQARLEGAVLRRSDEAGPMQWVLSIDEFWIHACEDKNCVTSFAEYLDIAYKE